MMTKRILTALMAVLIVTAGSASAGVIDVTPDQWYVQTESGSGATVTNRTSSDVDMTYTASYHGIIGALDSDLALSAVGDYIEFSYEVNGTDATYNANKDWYTAIGFFNDNGSPVTADFGTESDGSTGAFAAVEWAGGSRLSGVFDQDAGLAQILGRGIRSNGSSPAGGDGISEIGIGSDLPFKKNPIGRFRIELISATQIALTFTGESDQGDISGTQLQRIVDASTLPASFNQVALDFGADGDGSVQLDNLNVTTNVPEPATMSLLALGGLGVLLKRKK
jgi:hypothetical protein